MNLNCKIVANSSIVASMSQTDTKIATILHDHGLSLTKQRQFVFEQLEDRDPLSMQELYERCRGELDRASLYRIVSVFEQLGIVRRVHIGWKYKLELSDSFAGHHHHLTCLSCHTVIPINEAALEAFISNVAASHEFKPLEHQVEIQGLCKDCARSSEEQKSATAL